MSLLDRILRPRSADSLGVDDFWYQPISELGGSETGLWVNDQAATRIATVWACRRVIANSIATLPLHLYRRTADDDRKRATDHPLYRLLHDQPNERQTATEYWEMQIGHQVLRGNSYAVIVSGRSGFVEQLVPVQPDYVTELPIPGTSRLAYEVRPPGGETFTLPASQMHHVRGLSLDGVTGVSVISYARDTLGLSLSMERYRARFFRNNATPSLAIMYPAEVDGPAMKDLLAKLNADHGGYAGAHKAIVLDQGGKIEKIGLTGEDAQWLEGTNATNIDICRWFGVDPYEVFGSTADSQTYANVEQRSLRHVQSCLRPVAVRNEQAIKRDLILPDERTTLYAEWNFDGLLRADFLTRMQGNQIAIASGIMSPDEARKRENWSKRPDGGGAEFATVNKPEPVPQGGVIDADEEDQP